MINKEHHKMSANNQDHTTIKELAMAKKMDIFLRIMGENFKKFHSQKAKEMLCAAN